VRYSLTEHEKVTLMSFPIGDRILCISATPNADMNKIREKVMRVLNRRRSRPSIKASRKKVKNK
jgi:hypothetical protein